MGAFDDLIPQANRQAATSQNSAASGGMFSDLIPQSNPDNPPGTAFGRAIERGALRTASALPFALAQADSTALVDAGMSDEDFIRDAFKEATGLDAVPEGLDLSTPESAAAAISEMGFPAQRPVLFRELYDIRLKNRSEALENTEQFAERGASNFAAGQDLMERSGAIAMSPAAERARELLANTPDTLGDTLKVMAENPGAFASFLGEVGAESIPQIGASAATGLITRNPAASAAVMGAGAVAMEYGPQVQEFLTENNITLETPEDAVEFLNSGRLREASSDAVRRGLVIAAFEVMGQGVGARQLLRGPIGNAIAQTGVQMATGGAGEAAAQVAIGESVSPQEVLIEALAEGTTAPLEVGTAVLSNRNNPATTPDDFTPPSSPRTPPDQPDPIVTEELEALTPEDRASPLPDDVIAEGRAELRKAEAGIPPEAPSQQAAPEASREAPTLQQNEAPGAAPDVDSASPEIETLPEFDGEELTGRVVRRNRETGETEIVDAPPEQPQAPEPDTFPEFDPESGQPTGRVIRVVDGRAEVVAEQNSESSTANLDRQGTEESSSAESVDGQSDVDGGGVAAPIPSPEAVDGIERTGNRSDAGTAAGSSVAPAPRDISAVDAQPATAPVESGNEPASAEEVSDTPANLEVLDAASVQSVETDAQTFQYKEGGDTDGVTDRLRGVRKWEPERAGVALVYEYDDGRRVVVDGHQRMGLARRLASEGQSVELPVRVLRQSDGVSEAEARARGALKNIGEGTGTSVDAAKVFRETRMTPEQMNLPPQSALVRQGQELSRLSSDAFGMVINDVASPKFGAAVGRIVSDQSKHSDILGLVARLQPTNQVQTEAIIHQANEASATETQDSLFGEEEVSANLYLERAKVLDRTLKDLGKDASTFKVLASRADTITEAGNVLRSRKNEARLSETEQVREMLQREANTKGPISEALTEAARAVRDGGSIADASRAFLQAARRGNEAGNSGGGGRRGIGQAPERGSAEAGQVNEQDSQSANNEGPQVTAGTTSAEPLPQASGADAGQEESLSQGQPEASGAIRDRSEIDSDSNARSDRGSVRFRAARSFGSDEISEPTPAGEQVLTPGVAPITDRDRLQQAQDAPLRGGDAKPEGGRDSLFGDPAERGDLFDQAALATSQVPPKAQAEIIPALRKELDRMFLKRVNIGVDPSNKPRQGATRVFPDGQIDILIGHSLDPEKTLYHESIHALKALDVFTDEEWSALTDAAAGSWIAKHEIDRRYPNLSATERYEEAIAEEYAQWAAERGEYQGLVAKAFSKIKRFLGALRRSLTGAGYNAPEDIFEAAYAGQMGRRSARNTGEYAWLVEQEQALPSPAQIRSQVNRATGTHIPMRSVADQSFRANSGILARIRGAGSAIYDQLDYARIFLQDSMLPVQRAEQALERQGAKIDAKTSTYRAADRFFSRAHSKLEEINQTYKAPIIKAIQQVKGGLKLEDTKGNQRIDADAIDLYLTARHAPERNAHMQKVNPNLKPGEGSGMTDAEAKAILAKVQKHPNRKAFEEVARLHDAMRDESLQARVDAGLLSKTDADAWKSTYKFYTPLRGFAETDHAEASIDTFGARGKFNTGGKDKRALGRTSEAFSPLSTMFTIADEVAIRAEKNAVSNTLLEMVRKHSAPDMWEVKQPENQRVFNSRSGMVETRVIQPENTRQQENEIALKENGQEVRIVFNDPRLAVAMGSLGTSRMSIFGKAMLPFSRLFSATVTMLNPEFTIINAMRDVTAAQINIGGLAPGKAGKIRKDAMKNWLPAFRGAYQAMRGKSPNNKWVKAFKAYEKAGGKIAFFHMMQPDATQENVRRKIDIANRPLLGRLRNPSSLWTIDENPALRWIETANLAVDNAIRLAIWQSAVDNGMSPEQASSMSKNVTVNFNRRGQWGAELNAIFPFFNAAMQGSHMLIKLAKTKPVRRALIGAVAIGFFNDLLQSSMSPEDDDGELAYDKIPDYIGQRNLIIPFGGEDATTIPLPYGFNAFFHAGQQLGKIARGVKEPNEAFAHVFAATSGAFAPINGSTVMETITPGPLDPLLNITMNEDWLGRPIRPENPYADYGVPAYNAFSSTANYAQAISAFLNDATGGNRLEDGAISIYPDHIEFVVDHYLGGLGRFVERVGTTASRLNTGEELETYQTPFLRVLRYETGEFLDQNRYFEFRDVVREARDSMKEADAVGIKKRDINPTIRIADSLYDPHLATERKARPLRSERRSLFADRSLPPQVRREKIAELDLRLNKIYLEFNEKFIRALGPQAE